MKNISLILSLILILGCSKNNDGIKQGTFKLYENDTIVGTIYRINNYQVEKYLDSSELIARLEYQTDSTYLMRGIEEIQIGIDSIIWLINYKEITKKKYKIRGTPHNANFQYQYDATLVKVDNNIPLIYRRTLDSLNLK